MPRQAHGRSTSSRRVRGSPTARCSPLRAARSQLLRRRRQRPNDDDTPTTTAPTTTSTTSTTRCRRPRPRPRRLRHDDYNDDTPPRRPQPLQRPPPRPCHRRQRRCQVQPQRLQRRRPPRQPQPQPQRQHNTTTGAHRWSTTTTTTAPAQTTTTTTPAGSFIAPGPSCPGSSSLREQRNNRAVTPTTSGLPQLVPMLSRRSRRQCSSVSDCPCCVRGAVDEVGSVTPRHRLPALERSGRVHSSGSYVLPYRASRRATSRGSVGNE